MGLFGGGNSSSSTTNNTFNTDRRIALDNQSQGITGDGNSITVNTTATDHGSIIEALKVGGSAVAGANQSLTYALNVANSTANNAIASNASTVHDALAATTSATRDALAAVTGANTASLSFASTVNRDSFDLASRVNRDSLDLAARGQTLIANSAAESLGMVGSVVDLAFKMSDANSKRVSDAGMSASNLVGRAYETATAYQAEKQTADSKYLLYAAVAAVAIIAVRAL